MSADLFVLVYEESPQVPAKYAQATNAEILAQPCVQEALRKARRESLGLAVGLVDAWCGVVRHTYDASPTMTPMEHQIVQDAAAAISKFLRLLSPKPAVPASADGGGA